MQHSAACPNVSLAGPGDYLVFGIGKEEYAIKLQQVQELRAYERVTKVSDSPDCVMGVINLRGTVVPIVDMRIRFDVGIPTYDATTVVVVLNLTGREVGMVVDSVSDVVTLVADQIKAAPALASGGMESEYLRGFGTLGQRMLVMLDIDRLMTLDDMHIAEKMAA